MASFTINIPDPSIDRAVNGICGSYGYESNKLVDETKAHFAKRMQIKWVKDCMKKVERSAVTSVAYEAMSDEVELINITINS